MYKPLKEFNGECLAIIKKNNDDNKLIVVPRKQNYTDEQIEALISFQENNDYIIIRRNTIINDELINLASFLNQTYQSQLNMIKKQIVNIVINNSNDIFLIEHLLDELLNIPTCESERLYNYLCGYLDKFNKESAKYYKLEYKNMWN